MKEGKIEYIERQLMQDRIQTIKSISDESGVSLRAIGYFMNAGKEDRGTSLKTINKLYQYFKGKGRK